MRLDIHTHPRVACQTWDHAPRICITSDCVGTRQPVVVARHHIIPFSCCMKFPSLHMRPPSSRPGPGSAKAARCRRFSFRWRRSQTSMGSRRGSGCRTYFRFTRTTCGLVGDRPGVGGGLPRGRARHRPHTELQGAKMATGRFQISGDACARAAVCRPRVLFRRTPQFRAVTGCRTPASTSCAPSVS